MFKKIVLAVLAAALIAFVAIIAGCGATSSEASSRTTDIPLSTLSGEYHQTNTGIKGVIMSADISDNTIKVTMVMGDSSGIFWDGTFNTPKDIPNKFVLTSIPNTKMMVDDLYADTAQKTKQFTYNNGDLSYQFSVMGVSTVVHLSK